MHLWDQESADLRARVFRWLVCGSGLCCFLLLAACAPRLGDTEAALALEDIAAGDGPSRLKTRTPEPSRRTLDYVIDGRDYRGDLYRSSAGSRAGIVLVPGVVREGKDDPRLVALARTLARLGFAVMVPDLEGLRRLQVRASDVQEVVDAVRYLSSVLPPRLQDHIGVAGFSYGAGPVVLAALEPDVRNRVRFVLALGGYHDLCTIVGYFTTGYYRDPLAGAWRYLEPNPYAAWVFALSNADLLERPADRRRLGEHLRALAEQDGAVTPQPLEGLGPDAQALQDLLLNQDPARVPALLARLSPRMQRELEGIDPASHDLSRMRARVILVHGRSDNIIPYTESVALAEALPAEQVNLFLIDGFAHVDVQLERQDIPQLLQAMQLLLQQRAGQGASQSGRGDPDRSSPSVLISRRAGVKGHWDYQA
jgi:acetyl esterase/lipase